ncbi:MAG: hypothetical protein Q4D53_01225 [Leptotrichiaceae bacterium]|nr:hypothetical protein [Leptotrichiaceae bacterium]
MKKLVIILVFLIKIFSPSKEYEFDFALIDSNKGEMKKGKEVFLVEVKDWWDYPEENKFSFRYYDNGVIEIIFLDNYKKNLVKVDRQYKKIVSEEINLFLKNMELDKIKELEEYEVFYPVMLFSIKRNNERRMLKRKGCTEQFPIYEKTLEEYRKKNNGKNPRFIRIFTFNKKKILYDITYNDKNFVLSPVEEYRNEKISKFISFINYFIEKQKNDNPIPSILYLKNSRDFRKLEGISSSGCIDKYIPIIEIREEIELDNEQKDFEITRKKYIDKSHWNISKIYISEYGKVNIKSVDKINGINSIIFKDERVKDNKDLYLSENTVVSLSEDDYDWKKIREINGEKVEGNLWLEFEARMLEVISDDEEYNKEPEKIISKMNIVKNQKSDYGNPKIQKFNEKDIKNPIIYEVSYKGYMFRIVGDEKLYENQEIKNFIKYLKSLEKYF